MPLRGFVQIPGLRARGCSLKEYEHKALRQAQISVYSIPETPPARDGSIDVWKHHLI